MYLPLIKAVATAAGLVTCCITLEEKISLLCSYICFCNCRANFYPDTYQKPHNSKIQQEEKLTEFKLQKTGQKNAYSTNSVSFGHNNTMSCQDYPPKVKRSSVGFLTNCHFLSKAYLFLQNAEVFSKASINAFTGNTKAIQICRGHWMGAAVFC